MPGRPRLGCWTVVVRPIVPKSGSQFPASRFLLYWRTKAPAITRKPRAPIIEPTITGTFVFFAGVPSWPLDWILSFSVDVLCFGTTGGDVGEADGVAALVLDATALVVETAALVVVDTKRISRNISHL